MMDAEKNSHFEAGRHSRANRIADGLAIEVEKIDAARGKARFDVSHIANDSVLEDRFGAGVVAFGRVEKIGDIAEQFGFKMCEVAKAKLRRP